MLVARRFAFFNFNLKAKALIFACAWVALASVRGNEKGGNVVLCLPDP